MSSFSPETDVEEQLEHAPQDGPRRIKVKEVKVGEDVPKEVQTHIEKNSVLATDQSSICVDGGYRPEEAMGELARAGADAGLAMGLMAFGVKPEKAVEVIYNFRVSRNQKFGWHTDTHEHHTVEGGGMCGCGHANAAATNASSYALEADKMREMWATIKAYQNQDSDNMRFVNLNRKHNEAGILVVNSLDTTVLPWDLQKEKQFFVYDKAIDIQLVNDLVYWLAENEKDVFVKIAGVGSDVEINDQVKEQAHQRLMEVLDYHTNVTLALLGSSQGKPMYQVEYEQTPDGYITKVEKIGDAPSSTDEITKPNFLN